MRRRLHHFISSRVIYERMSGHVQRQMAELLLFLLRPGRHHASHLVSQFATAPHLLQRPIPFVQTHQRQPLAKIGARFVRFEGNCRVELLDRLLILPRIEIGHAQRVTHRSELRDDGHHPLKISNGFLPFMLCGQLLRAVIENPDANGVFSLCNNCAASFHKR